MGLFCLLSVQRLFVKSFVCSSGCLSICYCVCLFWFLLMYNVCIFLGLCISVYLLVCLYVFVWPWSFLHDQIRRLIVHQNTTNPAVGVWLVWGRLGLIKGKVQHWSLVKFVHFKSNILLDYIKNYPVEVSTQLLVLTVFEKTTTNCYNRLLLLSCCCV